MSGLAIAIESGLAVALYYTIAWLLFGRDPKPGNIVPQYEPPRGMSAAALRYYWLERFDERVFLCGLLGLVTRGLAEIVKPTDPEDDSRIRVNWPPNRDVKLPPEEAVLYKGLCTSKGRNGLRLTLLNDDIANLAVQMHSTVMNTRRPYFTENRPAIIGGLALSVASIFVVARPNSPDQFGVLAWSLPVLLFPAGYLYLLVQRVTELVRLSKRHPQLPAAKRLTTLSLLVIPCIAGVVCGCVMLGVTFGSALVVLLGLLFVVNALFLYLMKAPTKDGRRLMDEIEGFREFLQRVEHLPLDRSDAPSKNTGLYEQYLPYALALDVEQEWCDQLAALTVSGHDYIELDSAHTISLGMWNGKPVQVAYRAQTRSDS